MTARSKVTAPSRRGVSGAEPGRPGSNRRRGAARDGHAMSGMWPSAEILRDLAIVIVLAAATFAVYAPVRDFEFVLYDDLSYVVETPEVAAGLTWKGFLWALRSGALANWHPMTWLSHMLDVELFGLDAGAHHVTSLLLHVANTLLLYVVLRRMTRAVWPCALVAALFALHPLHVESVAWVAERKDVLSAFFFLMTLLAYALYAERPGAGRYLAALSLFALGLMSKPMLVTTPFVLLLLDVWPLGRTGSIGGLRGTSAPEPRHSAADAFGSSAWKVVEGPRGSAPSGSGMIERHALAESALGPSPVDPIVSVRVLSRLALEKVPFFALAAASCLVTFLVQRHAGAVARIDIYPLSERLLNAVMSYGRYLGKCVWPEGLAAFYPHPTAWPLPQVAGVGLLLLALTLGAGLTARRHPYLAVGWLWFAGTLVPVIGLVQVGMQSMADRYTYIPSIGLFLALAWGIEAAARNSRQLLMAARFAAAGAVVALAFVAASQVRVWETTFTLFENALATTSENPVAHNLLGLALVRSGRIDEGIVQFTEALRIKPHHVTHFNVGLALAMRGRFDEAIAHYKDAIRGNPADPKFHSHLGDALYQQGMLAAAQSEYEASLRLQPAQPGVLTNLGACLADQGRTGEAVDAYARALRVDPAHAQALNNFGVALASQGKVDDAIARYTEAVRVKPDYADAHMNLANLLVSRGRAREAVPHYEAVLRLRPNDPTARSGLGKARLARHDDR